MNTFRFGLQQSNWESLAQLRDFSTRAEDLGYSSICAADHFDDQWAPLISATAIAASTHSINVGTLVLANDYRHPVVLAKEIATLDRLSGGRVELGIGAGWMATDYESSGISYDRPGVRVDRLAESVTVLKGLFSDEPVTFSGEHYRLDAQRGTPQPVQRPHPKIHIGGGARRILELAGREADIIGINFDMRAGAISPDLGPNGTADATLEKLAWVRAGAGDRFDSLELSVTVFFAMVTDDRSAMATMMAGGFQLEPQTLLASPHVLLGTTDEMIDTLQARREQFGFTYIVVPGAQLDAFAPVVAALAGQ